MSNVTIQKRGNFYQYKFEIAKVDGKRKFLSKSGFKTNFIKINPGIGLKLPKYDIPPKDLAHIFTNEEINLILDRFKNNYCVYYAFLTAYCTGLRVAEVFALTWDDIDFENRVINVKHIVYDKPKDDKGRWYIGTTKTKQDMRKINISTTLYNALLNYKKKQQYMKNLYGKEYHTYHFEDVLNKYGKVVEQRIVQNKENIIQMNKADMVFIRPNGKLETIKLKYDIMFDK